MSIELEKAQVMFKLARKENWGACYDRTEHFKRFQNLDEVLKELSKIKWVIIHKKPKFEAISLNTEFKKEIVEFIKKEISDVKGMIK